MALTRLVTTVPARAIDYPDTAGGIAAVEQACAKRHERCRDLLVRALRDQASVAGLDGEGWTRLIATARAEALVGSLAFRVERSADARVGGAADGGGARGGRARHPARAVGGRDGAPRARVRSGSRRSCSRAPPMPPPGCPPRRVARSATSTSSSRPIGCRDTEGALTAAGWEPLKTDAYDEAYYRRWMHELPPLIHRDRDRMIDVHHTILPITATPDARCRRADRRLRWRWTAGAMLASADMIVHAAAHLFADGDLSGGLRNLWDIDRLLRLLRHRRSGLLGCARRVRTPPPTLGPRPPRRAAGERPLRHAGPDRLARAKQSATRSSSAASSPATAGAAQPGALTRLGFYVRSHWLRMPPLMLARHLWTKARR